MTPATPPQAKVLLIGYGNPGRLDDGLGPALAAELQQRDLPGLKIDIDYQLNIEHAAELGDVETVVFADADLEAPHPFSFRRIGPEGATLSYTTHSVEPEAVLALAVKLFGQAPEGWVLGICGEMFDDFGQRLSETARQNLAAAVGFLENTIRTGDWREHPPAGAAETCDC